MCSPICMNEEGMYLFVCPSLRTVQSFPPKSPRSPPEVIAVAVSVALDYYTAE